MTEAKVDEIKVDINRKQEVKHPLVMEKKIEN